MDSIVIENLLKLITAILLWVAIGQTLLLAAVYSKLNALLAARKNGDNNSDKKGDTINNRVKK